MLKRICSVVTFCTAFCFAKAQTQVLPADTVPAKIKYQMRGDTVKYSAELRPLRAIAGAPAPFYTYLWEFGDGNFSFQPSPAHIYADTGIYHPIVYATNNYDDGKPPPRRPGSIQIKQKANSTKLATNNFFKADELLVMKTNAMPKPEEEMVLILGYKNDLAMGSLAGKGALLLFYNDKEFAKNNFVIDTVRRYHGETKTDQNKFLQLASLNMQRLNYYASNGPSNFFSLTADLKNKAELLKERLAKYRDIEAYSYQNLAQGEERFIFFSIKTTPEMLADTNAVVTLSAMMIPDDPLADVNVFDLELQIVASHDPNKMMLRNRSMNYRFVGKNRRLTYKVRFQNTGKGPAKTVNVGVRIPDVLDKSTIKIIGSKPEVVLRDSAYIHGSVLDTLSNKDSVHFVFRNIYLPGTQQEGVNDADSTKGFVEYSIKFKKKPKKLPFESGAAIVFDKNEPIYTNRSRGKFKPGISPGIISGYGFLGTKKTLNNYGNKNYSLGFSVSPYSPYRKYLQAELYLGYYNASNEFLGEAQNFKMRDTVINNRDGYLITGRSYYAQTTRLNLDVVPLQLRYNINSFVGLGVGGIFSLSINEKRKIQQFSTISGRQATGTEQTFVDERQVSSLTKSFASVNTAGFVDLQLGLVRKGPALGLRYIQSLNYNDGRFFSYLSWKF
ncbi:hypothetical protein BCY91_12895 [Pelobium manganitolerans]|uniref:PKD domain-containing protein n=1 Tax=Pelobium manganitolerans TaxID=1842495 RepID=A0A419SAZ3_9SPHI|nr:PKD domain-containing protein [Pelobium manganitolerans]RKD19634.1 hypothetical protein BCY91_12895 [Pelobium manganitolerans]